MFKIWHFETYNVLFLFNSQVSNHALFIQVSIPGISIITLQSYIFGGLFTTLKYFNLGHDFRLVVFCFLLESQCSIICKYHHEEKSLSAIVNIMPVDLNPQSGLHYKGIGLSRE